MERLKALHQPRVSQMSQNLRCSLVFASAAILVLAAAPAYSAALTPAAPAAGQPGGLFDVNNVKVDAMAESAIAARAQGMAQGAHQAFTKLFRRLTATSVWSKEPQITDAQAQKLVLNVKAVDNERRSTTRYLADVSYSFNPNGVRALLRQSGVAFAETPSRPAIVIPIVGETRFDRTGPWAKVWNDPSYRQGLVPMILPEADAANREFLSRSDLVQLDWTGFAPLVRRYNAAEIVIAIESPDGKTVQAIEITPAGRSVSSFAYANPNLSGMADALTDKVAEAWKIRSSVDYGTHARLTVDVTFDSLEQWAKIRASLGSVRAISAMEVVGLTTNEAEIDLEYFGRMEQLPDALAQQNLILSTNVDGSSLQLGQTTADSSK